MQVAAGDTFDSSMWSVRGSRITTWFKELFDQAEAAATALTDALDHGSALEAELVASKAKEEDLSKLVAELQTEISIKATYINSIGNSVQADTAAMKAEIEHLEAELKVARSDIRSKDNHIKALRKLLRPPDEQPLSERAIRLRMQE